AVRGSAIARRTPNPWSSRDRLPSQRYALRASVLVAVLRRLTRPPLRLCDFALQFAQQPASAHEVIIEDPPGESEQVADQRIAQRVANGQSGFFRAHDALPAEHGQLLRDDRLIEGQGGLQLLHGAAAAYQDLENPDAHRVREGA